ncbi:MAG: response regulator transcription factor [Bacteroidota bacterium]|nr:response regulator transcription factor [Bacteroidota bacterium]
MKLLVVEDEDGLRETIVSFLEEEGYQCEQATRLNVALNKVADYEYDCVLVDIGLPDGSGLQLIREIKKIAPTTGVLVISARNSLDDKVAGLELGADDYLAKPFHLAELNARIKSILRRVKYDGKIEVNIERLRILPESRQVFFDDEAVVLTKKEFDLLAFFAANANRVLTKESIAEHLWGDFADAADTFDFVYSQIKNLRRKLLEKTGIDYFKNVYGIGYMFQVDKK